MGKTQQLMNINIGVKDPFLMNEKEFHAFLFNNGFADWSLKYLPINRLWSDPTILITDRYENTIYFEYTSKRIDDSKTMRHKGNVDFESYVLLYEKADNKAEIKYFDINDINYLIEQGYKVKLSSFN